MMSDMSPDQKLEQWSYRLFLAGVFCITFSIALGETFLSIAMLLLTIFCVRSRRIPAFPLCGWVLVFVVIAVVTATMGINPEKGVLRLKRLFWLSVIPLSATLIYSRARVISTLKAFSMGCGILFLDVGIRKPIWVLQKMQPGHRYADLSFREALTKRGSMTDGEMLMLGVLVSLGLFFMLSRENRKHAMRWLLLAGLQVFAVLANFKRGAWVCTGLFATVMVASTCSRKTLLYLLVAMGVAAWTPWAQERFAETADQLDLKRGARWAMWTKVAPPMIKDHPRGVGYGAVNNRLMRYYYRYVEPGRSHLHNNFLQVLVETGWLGFAVYLGWMAHAILNAARFRALLRRGPPVGDRTGTIVLIMLLAILLHGLVEYNFGDAELLIVLCMVMGISGRSRGLVDQP